jgi:hypothetical protein
VNGRHTGRTFLGLSRRAWFWVAVIVAEAVVFGYLGWRFA